MENKTLVILPQIEDLLYPLKSEELAHLERSILAEGVRDPLVVWDRGDEAILIDGHHRYAIAKKHGIEYEVKVKQFADMEDVLDWVDKNQLGRRNLSDEERTLTIGRIYQRVRDQRAAARVQNDDSNNTDGDKSNNTIENVAENWNISTGTIKRANNFALAIDHLKSLGESGTQAATLILSGEIADAITELPKMFLSDADKFPMIAAGICSGAKKIKDIIQKPKDAKPETTKPAIPETRESPSTTGEDLDAYKTFGKDEQSSSGIFDDESGDASPGNQQSSEKNPIEIQANILQLFSCFEVLQEADPEKVFKELPSYVIKQVVGHIDSSLAWMMRFNAAAKGQNHAE